MSCRIAVRVERERRPRGATGGVRCVTKRLSSLGAVSAFGVRSRVACPREGRMGPVSASLDPLSFCRRLYSRRVRNWGDEAVVIRGGVFSNPEAILDLVLDATEAGYGPELSVWIADPWDHGGFDGAILHLCSEAGVPHKKVRCSTVGRLREQGFALKLDMSDGQPECHHHVIFPSDPTIADAERFINCFDPPIPNPTKETKT